MNTITIYAAGPIDDVSMEEAHGWRSALIEILPTGVLVFNPAAAWLGASQAVAEAVDYGNRCMILVCDGVLVNLAGAGRAFGTIREIEFARGRGIPVAVCTGNQPIVSWLAHDIEQRATMEDTLDQLMLMINEKRNSQGIHPMLGMLLGRRPEDDEQS